MDFIKFDIIEQKMDRIITLRDVLMDIKIEITEHHDYLKLNNLSEEEIEGSQYVIGRLEAKANHIINRISSMLK